ncbi:hypothetical protein LWP59_11800 [Amycolatopsis acidiphila]|uniref:DUF4352 domain-containing protein n=1 Tax=Amycolatopsis acidiphila TaxID=715473 RepID=A0A558A0T1_9PSEU|nr:hypothetical protein [Amycolatopsis acidiphila]TVT17857.1 hypothetical protein FNH06_29950 [Amycolatopsis acidiphila]UIJ62248.1 hypothetical protein LWP59_11800 [Amycolatopsis acidiphila]GHG92871.1 hypothetical protein GCM10017788_69960 [Amycolatopsis acidiphila]
MTYQPPPPHWTPPPRKPKLGAALFLGIVGALAIAGAAVGITLAVTQYDDKTPVAARPIPSRSAASQVPSSPRHIPRTIETKVGEQVSFVPQDGAGAEVVFAITKITVDGRCTAEYAQKSENGHFLFLEVSVGTSPTMASIFSADLLNAGNLAIVGTDGVTETGNTLSSSPSYGCVPRSRMLPLTLGPGQKYTGTIVLDSSNTRGKLRLTPVGSRSDGDSWQWQLGEVA